MLGDRWFYKPYFQENPLHDLYKTVKFSYWLLLLTLFS